MRRPLTLTAVLLTGWGCARPFHPSTPCDPCEGCCDPVSAQCFTAATQTAEHCGPTPGTCSVCAAGSACVAGRCALAPVDAGSGDGGAGAQCPSAPPLRPGLSQDYAGDNTSHSNSNHGSCIFPYYADNVPESLYGLSVPTRSMLDLALTDGDYVGGLYLRDCSNQELQCNVAAFPFYRNAALQLVVDPGDYYLVVERDHGYHLVSTILPAQRPFGNDRCASAWPVTGIGGYFEADTTTLADRYSPACEPPHDGGAPDSLFRIDLPRPAEVTLAIAADFAPVFSLQADSCDGGTVTCNASSGSYRGWLDAGTYFLLVSGRAVTRSLPDGGSSTSPAYGAYGLRVELRDGG